MQPKIKKYLATPYPCYEDTDDTLTRMTKCIAHEYAMYGTAEAAASAILRDIEAGYIKIEETTDD